MPVLELCVVFTSKLSLSSFSAAEVVKEIKVQIWSDVSVQKKHSDQRKKEENRATFKLVYTFQNKFSYMI